MSDEKKIPEDQLDANEWVVSDPPVASVVQSSLEAARGDTLGEEPSPDPKNPWVDAGAAVVATILTKLLGSMDEGTVKIAMAVNNFTDHKLTMPKFALYSGAIVDTAMDIPAGKAGFCTAQKKWGTFGTFGVLTYDITGTKKRLAIMWSVPYRAFSQSAYANWFKLSVIPNTTPVNAALYDDMYYNHHKLTVGNCALADNGADGWSVDGYRLEGVMGTGGICTLNLSFKKP